MARTLPKSDPKIEVPREELRQEVAVVRRDDAAEAVNARLEGRDAACARNDASAEEDGRRSKSPPASHRMSPTLIVSWEEAGLPPLRRASNGGAARGVSFSGRGGGAVFAQ